MPLSQNLGSDSSKALQVYDAVAARRTSDRRAQFKFDEKKSSTKIVARPFFI